MSFINNKPRYLANTTRPENGVTWNSAYCGGCGTNLAKLTEAHICTGVFGKYCTQCGQMIHPTIVCSPDARTILDV